MSYKVSATRYHAEALLRNRNRLDNDMDDSKQEEILAEILIEEKGYPQNTKVIINAPWDEVEMTLVTEPDGSWELV